MHRCSSCGFFHNHHHQPNSFSMFFSNYDQNLCPYASSSSSSVDCTLSLATPSSTRSSLTSDDQHDLTESSARSSSRFCWDFLHSDNHSSAPTSRKTDHHGAGVDSLLARRCANCDTTSTPLWRNGPRGPKSLCNACGIRFKKEERRANAAATAVVGGGATEGYNGNTWIGMQMQHTQTATTTTHKLPSSCYSPAGVGNEFRFVDDVDDRDSTFLSWRLNVTDRAGLVHDFTRY